MTKRRARLNDSNDPLSSTDRVLSGFEQISQSTSQKADKSKSQKANDKSTSQPESNTTSQQYDVSKSQPGSNTTSQQPMTQSLTPPRSGRNTRKEASTSQQSDQMTSQKDDVSTSQQESNSTSQQPMTQSLTPPRSGRNTLESALTSQQPDQMTSQQYDTPTSQPESNTTIEQVNLLASQQVNAATLPSVEKPKLRKSTFQISEAVLHQLDQLHLTLQLELGKANAPYKEVIVESALVRLLESVNSDRAALIEALVLRQKSRDKI